MVVQRIIKFCHLLQVANLGPILVTNSVAEPIKTFYDIVLLRVNIFEGNEN